MNIEPTMRGMLSMYYRQRSKIRSIFLSIVLVGLAYIMFAHPGYEGAGSMLVKFGRTAVPGIAQNDMRNASEVSQNDRREIIESDLQILSSHDLLKSVIDEFGAETLYPGISKSLSANDSPDEAVIRRLVKGDLTLKAEQQSDIIEVRLINENPKVAADFVRRLMDVFIARQSEVYNNPHTNFMQEEVEKAEQKLALSQKELQDFKAHSGVSSIDEELTRLIQEKGEAETISFQALGDAQTKLADLRAKETVMLATYKADSTPVRQLHESVIQAEKQVAELQADLKTGRHSGSGILGTHMNDLNRKIDELEKQRNLYNDLVRQVKIDEDNYTSYKKHNEEARINETLNDRKVTRISIVDQPVVNLKPVRPPKMIIMGLCIFGGLLIGLGVGLLAETFDERFVAPEQVAAVLQMPIMATFPSMKRKY